MESKRMNEAVDPTWMTKEAREAVSLEKRNHNLQEEDASVETVKVINTTSEPAVRASEGITRPLVENNTRSQR